MRIDDETCYRALTARDARFDGLFFVGVTSTRIYCRPICTAQGGPRPLPVLLEFRPGRARRVSPVPAVPAGAGTRTRSGRCRVANGEGGRPPDRSRCSQRWPRSHAPRRRPGLERAPVAPGRPAGIRRVARRAGPDPALAPGQTIAHRIKSTNYSSRIRERVRKRAPIQCAVSLALPTHSVGDAPGGDGESRPRLRSAHARLSAAPGLGGLCAFSLAGRRRGSNR